MLISNGGSSGGLVTVADLPGQGVDLDAVSTHAKALAVAGAGVAAGAANAASAWQRVPAVYQSTGTESLYSAMTPVTEHGQAVDLALSAAQKALDAYVSAARPVLVQVAQLRSDVEVFGSAVVRSYPKPTPSGLTSVPPRSPSAASGAPLTYHSWQDDPSAVAANDELAARAAQLAGQLLNLQSECASAIRRAAGLSASGRFEGAPERALASRSGASTNATQAPKEGCAASTTRTLGAVLGAGYVDATHGMSTLWGDVGRTDSLLAAAAAQGWSDTAKWWSGTAAPTLGAAGRATLQWTSDRWSEISAATMSAAQAIQDHPDEYWEMSLGILTMVGGGAIEAGGGLLDATGVGLIGGIPLAAVGAGVITAGAGMTGLGATQMAAHALTDDRVDPQYHELFPKNESEAAPKSEDGPEPAKDPNGQHPDYPDRNNLGQYHNQDTVSKATEQKGLDKVDASDDFDEPVLRDQVEAHVDGVPHVRKYDGLGENPDGTYTGVEVKSASEVTKQGLNANTQQRAFDDLVSPEHPATATITKMINGRAVKVKIRITAVQLVTVAAK